jgi:hypothetical protein
MPAAFRRVPGRKIFIMSDLEQREIPRNSYRATRRDAPVNCPTCGREVKRRARQQRFCSTRCRQRTNRALKPSKIAPRYPHSRGATNAPKKHKQFRALPRAKTLSSIRIFGPADVLAVELFDRSWKPGISSGGVAIGVGRLRACSLAEHMSNG